MSKPNLHIEDYVILPGSRSDADRLLQGFDAFLLPSLFEGLPGSVVEAQAAGLPVLISDTVARESGIVHGLYSSLPIDQGVSCWSKKLYEIATANKPHENTFAIMQAARFDVKKLAKWYEKFYLSHNKELYLYE